MCEPVTLTAIAIGATVLATGVSVYSSIQQGETAKKVAKYNAAVAENNAVIADRQAEDALKRGETAELQQRLRIAKTAGAQRAAFGASGVVVDEADTSPLSILEDTHALGEVDALTIRNNAAREAYGYRMDAYNYRTQGVLTKAQGEAAAQSSYLEAGGSLLSGAAQVGSKWATYKTPKTGVG